MKIEAFVFFLVLVFSAEASKKKKNCKQCIPVQDCPALKDLSRAQQERWFEDHSCQTSQEEDDEEVSFLYGFAPFAKGDYVCCPDSNGNNNERQTQGNVQYPNEQNRNSNFSNRRTGNNNAGFNNDNSNPEFENKFGNNNRRPTQQMPNNNNFGNNNQAYGNQRPTNQQYNNDFDNNRRPNNNWNNGGSVYDTPNNNNFGRGPNTHQNIIQGQQNSNSGNNRQNQVQTENPYFMARTTTTQRPYNNRNNNSNRRIDNQQINNQGQCQALNSFPPEYDSGCCGRDASGEDRITATQRPKTFAPTTNQNPWFPDFNNFNQGPSFWPSWFPRSLSFFSSSDDENRRVKRDENHTENVNVTVDNRIAGGQATTIGQYPWLVLLKSVFDNGSELQAFNCGGSLISATYVLTAGHCVYDSEATLSDVEITLAEYDKRTFPNDCTNDEDGRRCIKNIRLHAADVIRHPEYDDTRLQNDIALIRLRNRAPYTEFIRPICLPPIDIDSPAFSNLPLHVSGWGRNGVYNSNVKQSTIVNLVPQRECRRHYSFLTRKHVCAAGYSGEDTCKGDSGGPLMLLYEGKYFVSGVVSGKRADSPCGTSVPSLYTNVYHYLDWIKSNIRN